MEACAAQMSGLTAQTQTLESGVAELRTLQSVVQRLEARQEEMQVPFCSRPEIWLCQNAGEWRQALSLQAELKEFMSSSAAAFAHFQAQLNRRVLSFAQGDLPPGDGGYPGAHLLKGGSTGGASPLLSVQAGRQAGSEGEDEGAAGAPLTELNELREGRRCAQQRAWTTAGRGMVRRPHG